MSDLRLEESRPGIGAVCGSEESVQLGDMEVAGIGKARQVELVRAAPAVGEVLPQGYIGSGAVGAAGGESEVLGAEGFGDTVSPPHENVRDYAEGRAAICGGDLLYEAAEGGLQRGRGVEEVDDLVEGQGFRVLGVGWEAMVGAVEGELR